MAFQVTCPQGHRWQFPQLPETQIACPVCGSACTVQGSADSLAASHGWEGNSTEFALPRAAVGPVRTMEGEPADIPGYEIVSLLGRGGMGEVHLARQMRLNRLVALKLLYRDRYLEPQWLVRFQFEGELLASIQHPDIVQVYEVGEHRGRPFLAMEFIDGSSLDLTLAKTRLEPMEAARLTERLARAMHAAHLRGVIHRDLKPANVLLTKSGEPKIGDFGLAKRVDEDDGLTRTGMIVGTPSYMAPEQAAREAGIVGPGVDVYALGAILYEMLTGQRMFHGATLLETLEQVRWVHPVPPSRINPRTPHDLETICLKCVDKAPARRYASAEALAEDLARYQRGEPILARPVGWPERAAKWARRRPAAAALFCTLVLSVSAAVIGGVWYNVQLRAARDRAERNFALAAQAAEEMFIRIADEQLVDRPGMEQTRRELLEAALPFYERLYAERTDDPAIQRQFGQAYKRVGDIRRLLGKYPEAEQAYLTAIHWQRQFLGDGPQGDPLYRQLIEAWDAYGELLRVTSRIGEAETAYGEAIQLGHERLDDVETRAAVGRAHYNYGILLKNDGRLEDARRQLTTARQYLETVVSDRPATRTFRHDLARCYLNLATVVKQSGHLGDADELAEQTIRFFERLREHEPNQPDYRYGLAVAHGNRGNLFAQSPRGDGAAPHYEQARELLRVLMSDYPGVPEYRREWANVTNGLAAHRAGAGELAEAEPLWLAAADQFRGLVELVGPEQPELHGDLSMVLGNLGRVAKLQKQPERARGFLEEAIDHMRRVLQATPDHAAYLHAAANQHRDLAAVLVAVPDLERLRSVAQTLVDLAPASVTDTRLAATYLDSACKQLAASPTQPHAATEEALRQFAVTVVENARQRAEPDWQFLATENQFAVLRSFPEVAERLAMPTVK